MEAINLNLIPNGTNPVVHCSQYDEGRKFRFNLFDGASVFVLDGTEDISCDIKKPDGNIVTAAVPNTEDDYIIVTTTLQMTACSGNSLGTINISKGGINLYTLNFVLYCERSPLENGIESESSIHNLNTMVDEMVAEEVATQYDSANVIFDNEPTDTHGIGYTVTSEGIKNAIDNAFDYDNTASGSLVHITDGADNIPVKSLVSEIVAVESGSGEKSPDNPYTISGFDSGVVSVCGVNLWDEQWELGTLDPTTGNNSSATTRIRSKNYIPVKPNTTYTYRQGTASGQTTGRVCYYDVNKNFISSSVYFPSETETFNGVATFTTPNNACYMRFSPSSGYGTTYGNNISINYPSSDTSYHAYNGNDYTFAFGQTVYGGHFDNKGNLVITHGIKTFTGDSSESWSEYSSYNGFYIAITDMKSGTRQNGLTNRFVTTYDSSHTNNSCWFGVNSNRLFLLECSGTTGATVADLKTWLANNNLTVIYPLANPIVLSITSQDIPTLLGENNIFSNCGDVEVTYYTYKSNDILEFIDSEIGKKNGDNIPIEANSQDSIKDYIDDEVSSTKDYIDNGLSGKVDTSYLNDMLVVERKFRDVTFDSYYQSIEIDVTKSGYTPIGTVGFQTNTVGAVFFRCNLSGNTLYIGLVARDGTTPITSTIATYVDILYLKNS